MFRIRFRVGPETRIDVRAEELVLSETGGVRVFLKSVDADQLVNDAAELVMRGQGYATESHAAIEGKRWVDALVIGTITEFIGAEFGERSPTGWLSPAGLELFSAAYPGSRVYNDSPGLHILPQSPQPIFSRIEANAIAGKNGDAIAAHVREAFNRSAELDEPSLLACEMYAASQFMPSDDSRFLMLMIAVEALIEANNGPTVQLEAIDELIKHLDGLSLSDDERRSLTQTIAGLKRESINSAGKRLSGTLDGRTYAGKSPKRFFRDCYELRSALVHGNLGRPRPETIQQLIGPLGHFVRDLVLNRNDLL